MGQGLEPAGPCLSQGFWGGAVYSQHSQASPQPGARCPLPAASRGWSQALGLLLGVWGLQEGVGVLWVVPEGHRARLLAPGC